MEQISLLSAGPKAEKQSFSLHSSSNQNIKSWGTSPYSSPAQKGRQLELKQILALTKRSRDPVYTPSFLPLIPNEVREKRWSSSETWWGQENSTILTSYFHPCEQPHHISTNIHQNLHSHVHHQRTSSSQSLSSRDSLVLLQQETQHLITTKKHCSSTALLESAGVIWCFKVYKISTKPPDTWEGKGYPTLKRHILPDLKLLIQIQKLGYALLSEDMLIIRDVQFC